MDTVAVTALRAGALTGLTADAGARTITGRLAVYDLAGHTSAGRTVFAAGAIAAPAAERVALLVEHDRSRAVGFATAIDDRGTELWASFYLPPGDAADAALQDAASGVRNGLSVGLEIAASHRDADGVLFITASTLREGSLVSVPAFQDTRVTEVAASSPDLPPPPRPGHRPPLGLATGRQTQRPPVSQPRPPRRGSPRRVRRLEGPKR